MLHEILMALLGFPGDIVVECHGTYKVRENFELLTLAEVEQINKLVPLGWFVSTLSNYTDEHAVRWNSDSKPIELYKSALCTGIVDFISEYTEDIANFELRLHENNASPIMLSQLSTFLQKYMLVVPTLYSICQEIEDKNLRGCGILDYLGNYRSGNPLIALVVDRMLLRVRGVFLKQCISWMLHGQLQDSCGEFFIQVRANVEGECSSPRRGRDDIYDRIVNKLASAKKFNACEPFSSDYFLPGDSVGFDWNSTYAIRLDLLPETHVSPRIAAKVVFCGKAVKLLQLAHNKIQSKEFKIAGVAVGNVNVKSWGELHGLSSEEAEVYNYISGFIIPAGSLKRKEADPMSAAGTDESSQDNKKLDVGKSANDEAEEILNKYYGSCGLSEDFVASVTNEFYNILAAPDQAVELFEGMVDKVNERISRTLWTLLNVHYGFKNNLMAMRNTYLMGRGELFQNILDGVYDIIGDPITTQQESDIILNRKVLRNTARLLNLDEVSFARAIELRLNSPNLILTSLNAGCVNICGTARQSKVNKNTINLSSIQSKGFSEIFSDLWSNVQHDILPSQLTKAVSEIDQGSFSTGAIWLPDQKYIAKGFYMATAFKWDLTNVSWTKEKLMTPDESTIGNLLGVVSFVVHCERSGSTITGAGPSGTNIMGSLSAGVSFYAKYTFNSNDPKYFMRLFISSKNDRKFRFSRGGMSGAASMTSKIPDNSDANEVELVIPMSSRFSEPDSSMLLELEYAREISSSEPSSSSSVGSVIYVVRVRLVSKCSNSNPAGWDIEIPLDIASIMKLQGGYATVGLVGSGKIPYSVALEAHTTRNDSIDDRSASCFAVEVSSLEFKGKGALANYPVASTFTSTRHPTTFARLETMVKRYRSWMTLKMKFRFPSIFGIIFDVESLNAYERVFAMLMKIRLVAHALQRVWMSRSNLSRDRFFNYIRHSMHFYLSNLMYYLQVDSIDFQFNALMSKIDSSVDFQAVLRAHRNFIANMVSSVMVDNIAVQECIERILQVCLRFIAICKLIQDTEGSDLNDPDQLVVPSEEIQSVQKDFFSYVLYFFQIMQKVDSKIGLDQLDFNGYLSKIAPSNNISPVSLSFAALSSKNNM